MISYIAFSEKYRKLPKKKKKKKKKFSRLLAAKCISDEGIGRCPETGMQVANVLVVVTWTAWTMVQVR